MMPRSGLYVGRVVHSRLRPRKHRLSYRCYWLLLDLDALDETARPLRFFSLERFNLFSFRSTDHETCTGVPVRAEAARQLAQAGIDTTGGKVFLLTMPRILGYGFNPLSVYYCYKRNGALAAMIYEVHNTFGERHSYLIPVTAAGPSVKQHCAKQFYVSPFMDMNLSYEFEVSAPEATVHVAVRVTDQTGLLLSASLAGQRLNLCDRSLLQVFFTHPILTFKVIAAIHWEALRLWWKGIELTRRPAPPHDPVTVVPPRSITKVLHE